MINEFKIYQLGHDFMGYKVQKNEGLSFHHLIVAHRDCKKMGIEADGYLWWNGSILKQTTSHDYLHLIERIDPEIFYLITSEMIDENIKGRLDRENLLKIRDLLEYFEREHCADHTKKGRSLINPQYVETRIKL